MEPWYTLSTWIVPLAFFATIAAITIIAIWSHFKKRALLSKEIIAAIEKGSDIPLPIPKERNFRNLGLIWTLVGLAFFIALWISSGDIKPAVWGLLPFALGIAFLLIYRYQQKENNK